MKQARDAALSFSRRAAANDCGNLRGKTAVGQFSPFAILEAGDDAPGNFLLRVPRVHAPDAVGGIFDLHLVVDDVDPYGFVGSSFDDDAVPAGKFQLRGEAAAEIAVAEPFNGVEPRARGPALRIGPEPA